MDEDVSQIDFANLGGILDNDDESESKFAKYGAYHKTNVVFIVDFTEEMMKDSRFSDESGERISWAYACTMAIRKSVMDLIKHSSLGGGGRDRVAIIGLFHNRTRILLDMQQPSAQTLRTIDSLMATVKKASPRKGSKIDLKIAFDIAFTLLKELAGDGQIFICTKNDEPCDSTKKVRGRTEETETLSKTADLVHNHQVSIKLMALQGDGDDFDMSKFWWNVVSDQNRVNEKPVLDSLIDLTQHIKALTRPTAIAVPNGNRVELKVRDPDRRGQHVFTCHVNLYPLSRSRNLDPTRSFSVDRHDRKFLVGAKVKDGRIVKSSSDLYQRVDRDEEDEEEQDDPPEASQSSGPVFQRKRFLNHNGNHLRSWTDEEFNELIKHDKPRTIEVLGFIKKNLVNTEFRGQSPQYLTLSKSDDACEASWWSSLWHCCRRLEVVCVALLFLGEKNAPKQVLLYPHKSHKDPQGTMRLPNGFYVHYLPYRERVYVEVRPPHTNQRLETNRELMDSFAKCLNHMSDRFFQPLSNMKSERGWRILEALALDKETPELPSSKPICPKELQGCMKKIQAICGSAEPPAAKKPRKK